MPTFKPSPKHLKKCEEHIAKMEASFREHYEKTGLVAKIEGEENPSDTLETYTFAFGIMASLCFARRSSSRSADAESIDVIQPSFHHEDLTVNNLRQFYT